MPLRLFSLLALALLANLVLAGSSWAACTSPTGTAGDVRYASNFNMFVFCNDTDWVSMAGWNNSSGGGASLLNELTDVDTTGASTGRILAYNGTTWVVSDSTVTDARIGTLTNGKWCTSDGSVINCSTDAPLTAASLLGDLANVDTTGAAAGNFLKFDGSSWVPSSTLGVLNDLSDVDTTGAATGKYLAYDGSGWVISDTTAGVTTLAALTDVNVTGAATGKILAYDGSGWVISDTAAASTAEGDRITSGTLAVVANSTTAIVSLSTGGTDWGYLGSGLSYLPQVAAVRASATTVSTSRVGFAATTVSNLSGGGGNFIASGTTSVSASSAGTIKFATGGNQRMVVNASGNVGIGATNPVQPLEVSGNISATRIIPDGGTAAAPSMSFNNDTGTNTGFFLAAQNEIGISSNAGERVRITTLAVGIGTSSPNQGKVEVKGGTVCVDTNSDDNATSCIANESDARLKTNVKPLENALDKVMRLRGVSFDWKVSDSEVLKHYPLISRFADNPHSIGLIAQEVQQVVPEAIEPETVGDAEVQYLQLDYAKLVPVALEAIKELKAQNEALRAEFESYKAAHP